MAKGVTKALLVGLMAIALFGCQALERPVTSRLSVTEPVSRPYVIEPQTIQAGDITISYMEAGQGPWVVLIHGGVVPLNSLEGLLYNPLAQPVLHSSAVAASDSWNYNIADLASRNRVVALDLPGFGGSDKPDIKYTREEFVAYVDAFMQAMGIDSATLVGHGLGGEIAIAYALEHPDSVDKLVLVNSYGAWGALHPVTARSLLNLRFPMKYWQKEKAAQINTMLVMGRKIWPWDETLEKLVTGTISQKVEEEYARNLVLSREGSAGKFLESVSEFKVKYLTTEQSRKEVHAVHQALMETKRKDLHERFGELQMPVLIVQGAHDPVVAMEQASYMEKALPKVQMIVYERSGHYPMVEEPERFNRDVSFFLSASTQLAASD